MLLADEDDPKSCRRSAGVWARCEVLMVVDAPKESEEAARFAIRLSLEGRKRLGGARSGMDCCN